MTSQPIKESAERKRTQKLNAEPFQRETKKQKIDLWAIECEKILAKFNELNVAIDLNHLSNNKKSFNERKAIPHNNYAIFLIENLNNAAKNYSDAEKIASLKKAEQLLEKSAEFYNHANLVEEKNSIEHCIRTIRSSVKHLETTLNQITKAKAKADDSPSIKTRALRTNPIINNVENLRKYQPILSTRLAYKFFNISFPEGDTQTTNPQNTKKISTVKI
ncbi:MAG: hypothetical protein WAL30_01180 [Candidatus Aquirickettsiella sp.]